VHIHHESLPKHPRFKRFGFAGLCFGVAFICWAIQKGDAVLNPDLSWPVGLFWYAIATALCVAGVWLWDRSADSHIAIRIAATAAVIGLAYWVFHGPVIQQYRREHPSKEMAKAKVMPAGPLPAVTGGTPTAVPQKPRAVAVRRKSTKSPSGTQPKPGITANPCADVMLRPGASDTTITNNLFIGQPCPTFLDSSGTRTLAAGNGVVQLPQTPQTVNNCPNGICISGGTATNPTVINNGPPPPKCEVTSTELPVLPKDIGARNKIKFTVICDGSVSSPTFDFGFDRAFIGTPEVNSKIGDIGFTGTATWKRK
jgi:hypothetical protein